MLNFAFGYIFFRAMIVFDIAQLLRIKGKPEL